MPSFVESMHRQAQSTTIFQPVNEVVEDEFVRINNCNVSKCSNMNKRSTLFDDYQSKGDRKFNEVILGLDDVLKPPKPSNRASQLKKYESPVQKLTTEDVKKKVIYTDSKILGPKDVIIFQPICPPVDQVKPIVNFGNFKIRPV